MALTKNPKKRPTAEKLLQVSISLWDFSYEIRGRLIEVVGMLMCVFFPSAFQHPFVTQPLSRSLAIELLDKMNNPDHSTYHDFDDDDPEVGICFHPRIRLSFHLLTELNGGPQRWSKGCPEGSCVLSCSKRGGSALLRLHLKS